MKNLVNSAHVHLIVEAVDRVFISCHLWQTVSAIQDFRREETESFIASALLFYQFTSVTMSTAPVDLGKFVFVIDTFVRGPSCQSCIVVIRAPESSTC